MASNKDIAVLAKKVYELSVLPPAELESQKWQALLILNAVYSSATPEGVAAATSDRVARWGAQIAAEGVLSALHPKWHLRTDDGKPPVARIALESALTNRTATSARASPRSSSSRRRSAAPSTIWSGRSPRTPFRGPQVTPATSTSTSCADYRRRGSSSHG